MGFADEVSGLAAGLVPSVFRFRLTAVFPEFQFGQTPVVTPAAQLEWAGETLRLVVPLVAPTPKGHLA